MSSSQLPTGTIIFGRWSDAMIASWAGAEILVNPFVRAIQAEHLITLNLFVAVALRYSSAFVSSSDSASQWATPCTLNAQNAGDVRSSAL